MSASYSRKKVSQSYYQNSLNQHLEELSAAETFIKNWLTTKEYFNREKREYKRFLLGAKDRFVGMPSKIAPEKIEERAPSFPTFAAPVPEKTFMPRKIANPNERVITPHPRYNSNQENDGVKDENADTISITAAESKAEKPKKTVTFGATSIVAAKLTAAAGKRELESKYDSKYNPPKIEKTKSAHEQTFTDILVEVDAKTRGLHRSMAALVSYLQLRARENYALEALKETDELARQTLRSLTHTKSILNKFGNLVAEDFDPRAVDAGMQKQYDKLTAIVGLLSANPPVSLLRPRIPSPVMFADSLRSVSSVGSTSSAESQAVKDLPVSPTSSTASTVIYDSEPNFTPRLSRR